MLHAASAVLYIVHGPRRGPGRGIVAAAPRRRTAASPSSKHQRSLPTLDAYSRRIARGCMAVSAQWSCILHSAPCMHRMVPGLRPPGRPGLPRRGAGPSPPRRPWPIARDWRPMLLQPVQPQRPPKADASAGRLQATSNMQHVCLRPTLRKPGCSSASHCHSRVRAADHFMHSFESLFALDTRSSQPSQASLAGAQRRTSPLRPTT